MVGHRKPKCAVKKWLFKVAGVSEFQLCLSGYCLSRSVFVTKLGMVIPNLSVVMHIMSQSILRNDHCASFKAGITGMAHIIRINFTECLSVL